MECHLGGDGPHPHLQRAEGMFGRLATLAHGLRVPVEALLYRLQHVLMLPAKDVPGNRVGPNNPDFFVRN